MADKKAATTDEIPGNFIHDIIDQDLATGKHDHVVTRFPPEPNGYLHIGHAKSIVLNFGTAEKYDGRCHLRFDDTNPLTEDTEYVESIKSDVQWLGYDWGEHLYYASDYFEKMYDCAVYLIKEGKAYVDSLDIEEIRKFRGTVMEPGKESPYRGRSIEENLDLFERMRAGEFEDGEHVLRAIIDMSASNMLMRDPLLYRIRHVSHHHRGDEWCIYPMYDFAHCLEDAFEGITHSLCTLEFENNRELYDWVIEYTNVACAPRQYEFARLNLEYTVMSKRKLLRLVDGGEVAGWDDPRLPTIAGLRRRGIPASAIREFCHRIGVTKANSRVEYEFFETILRDDLNVSAPRVMGVLDPLKVVITNYPEEKEEWLEAQNYPHDVPLEGTREIPFSRELYIDRDDFMENPPSKWFRLAPGAEVRLRYGYYITCDEVVRDEAGEVVELRCSYDPETRGGQSPDGRTVKGTIHWVSAKHALPCEVRLYDRLFEEANPESDPEVDFQEHLNPDSMVVVTTSFVEPTVLDDDLEQRYQFERKGYFWRDPVDSTEDSLVFNRIVSLRDSWAKMQQEKKKAADEKKRREREEAREKARREQAEAPERGDIITERDRARESNPELAEKYESYQQALGINEELADVLSGDAETVDFFESALASYDAPKTVGPWLVNEVLHRIDEGGVVAELGLEPAHVAKLVEMVDEDRITTQISRDVLEILLKESGRDPETIISEEGLEKISDTSELEPAIDAIIEAHPAELQRFRDGNDRLIGFFIGQVMKETGGAADPVMVRTLLKEKLSP